MGRSTYQFSWIRCNRIMKTLVTGATGFVGSALVRQLLERGSDVRILRRTNSQLDLLGNHARSVEHAVGDVRDPESLQEAMRRVDCIYHVAGSVGVMARERRTIARMRRVNVEGTANVVDAALAAGIRRLVHTSSIAALGRQEGNGLLTDETATWQNSRMNSQYAISKRDAELQIHRGLAEGLHAVIVNPAVIFGPGRPGENTMRIFEAVKKLRGLLRIPSGGVNVVDVDDVAGGHILAMEHGRTGERYILGGENLSWATIFRLMAEAAGVPVPSRKLSLGLALAFVTAIEYSALALRKNPELDRKAIRGLFQFWRLSNDKAIQELGYSYRPFAETVKRMTEGSS